MADGNTKPKSPFELTRGIESRYAMRLRALAAKIGQVVTGYSDPLNDPEQRWRIVQTLNAYSDAITPWARALSKTVVKAVDWENRHAFAAHSEHMSRILRRQLETAPTGEMMRFMQAEQVQLIRSLPTEAAERVVKIAQEHMLTGKRAEYFAKEIARTGEVTKSRATLIARTETSRTSSNLTQARAIYAGSVDYVFETSRDRDVRPSHRRMQGQIVEWAKPPTLDGLRGHAGCFPNCRCHPAPRFPRF